jgi:anti-sigma factor RsiW
MDMLVHPYLDGELVAEERVLLEHHVAECPRCAELVGHEAKFKEHLRARLRSRAPAAGSAGLRARVLGALDAADAAGAGPGRLPWRWMAPAAGALATAAAIAIFFGAQLGGGSSLAGAPLIEAAIAGHRKNLPVEVGGTGDEIRSWMQGKVPVPVRPPNLRAVAYTTHAPIQVPRLIGARVSHLASRDAGQLLYRVGNSQLTVYVFDADGWDLAAPERTQIRTQISTKISGRDVFVVEKGGYSVALYRDRGVGYALASDLDEESLLRLLEASLSE